MSIKLRFTLLYSAILAITLLIFSIVLYSIQSETTLNALESDLKRSSQGLKDALMRKVSSPDFPTSNPPPKREPVPFASFTTDQEFQQLPEREITRVLDGQGNLAASPFGRVEDTLPLSSAGFKTLQNQQDWWETATVQGERMLIYNRPIVANGQVAYILQVARPLAERDRTLQALGTTLILASGIILLIAFGIGWLFSGVAFKPIHRITHTARKIGEERDFTRRVLYNGPQDEVGQLASTFNGMLEQLHDAYQKMANALSLQRGFVADVSHELRTPLTTLRGNLGLLKRIPAVPAPEQADILNDMEEESDRLIRLVNGLLVLARAESSRELAHWRVEIAPIMQKTCQQLGQLNPSRTITLEAPSNLVIWGDADAFKQIIVVALDNALKYTEGDIAIGAILKDSLVEVYVRDTGMGISHERLEHIFDRFNRGDEMPSVPGVGIGLAIAKSLTEAQGGTIFMESQVGKGSVIIMRFQSST
jgi:two-component system, OmpR family, sensor kinase